jgi:DNA-directed RNA polymerase specialized sigma subunit
MIEVLRGMFSRANALIQTPEALDSLQYIDQMRIDQNLSIHDIVRAATIGLSNQKWQATLERAEQSRIMNLEHEIRFNSIDTDVSDDVIRQMIALVPHVVRRHVHREPRHTEDHIKSRIPIEVV